MDRRIVVPLALIVVLALGIVGVAALTGSGDEASDQARMVEDASATTTSSSTSSTTSTSTTTTPAPVDPAASDPASAGNGDEPYVEVPCTDGTMCGEITTQDCQGAMCGEIAPQACPPGGADCGDVATQPCSDAAMCGDIRPQPDDSPL